MVCAFKPDAFEIKNDGGLEREYLESCSLTTKNIISPLPQGLWQPDLIWR